VEKVKAAGYPAISMHDHTLLAKQLDVRKPGKGYGVQVAKTWYWYENWFEKVIEKLAEFQGFGQFLRRLRLIKLGIFA
jgi:hypothetical protein